MTEGNSYEHFAMLYDALMADAPYENWLAFFKNKVKKHHPSATSVLEIGCGTGTLALMLAKSGFDVTGVDLSDEMLSIASAKLTDHDQNVTFIQQDMRELELGQTFPIATAFCDVINYLQTFEDVLATFKSIYDHLESGGLFMFDVHSVYKIDQVFHDASFCSADSELSYIWECFDGPYSHSVEHELSFFVRESNGLYSRYDETHAQRTFEKEDYIQALEDQGFTLISVEGDFKEGEPDGVAERLFFIGVKK